MTPDNIFAVTAQEGGPWIPWELFGSGRLHSILFKDGQTWDEINGFRGKLMDYTPKSMAIMRNNWASE